MPEFSASSADIPVCRIDDILVGGSIEFPSAREWCERFAGWKACDTADRNVCATLPAGEMGGVGGSIEFLGACERRERLAGWKACDTADKNVCATLLPGGRGRGA